MILVDVHAHLDHPDYDKDLDEVIDRAKNAGVKAIIANGINPETNRKVLEMAKKYALVKAALGMYPIEALANEIKEDHYPNAKPFDVDEELSFIKQNKDKIVALGEVGLDYKMTEQKEAQKIVFGKIIALAEKIKKPLIVHSRKAEQDVVDMLLSSNAKKIVLHCFSGKKSLIKLAADNGFNFSIPTNVVRSQHFQEMVKAVNLSQLFTETDAPYLSPFPGKRNEPAFVIETIKKIAEIKNMASEEVANNIYMNYQRLF